MSVDDLTALLSRMGEAGYALIFVAALLESAAMLGLFVPGEAVVLAAGFFAARGSFKLDVLFACVALGAAVGDSIGYEMGRRWGRALLVRFGPRAGLSEHRLQRVERFFAKYGAPSVFLGRFIGFARAVVPFIAGASGMRYRAFLPYNIAGALAWSAVVLLAGYFLGDSWRLVENSLGRAAAIGATVAAIAWLLRRQLRKPAALWAELLIVVLFVCAFAGIAEDVVTNDPLTRVDVRVLLWLEAHRTPAMTMAMRLVSSVHAPAPMVAATCALAFWLWRRRDHYWLKALVLTVPAGMLVNTLLKLAFHRARPALEHPLLTLHSYSFPSGHVAGATLFYGILCAVVFSRTDRRAVRVA
ncbi:MAG TPA: VTT domain-containing protein, partial [Ramlibacter sp.]